MRPARGAAGVLIALAVAFRKDHVPLQQPLPMNSMDFVARKFGASKLAAEVLLPTDLNTGLLSQCPQHLNAARAVNVFLTVVKCNVVTRNTRTPQEENGHCEIQGDVLAQKDLSRHICTG